MNIEDVIGKEVGEMSLNELKGLLKPKIKFYKQFKAIANGVFVK